MKCVAVSDFHLRDIVTPPADLLIVAGDMTMVGDNAQLDWFEKWLSVQPQKYKIWIAGNHELGLEQDFEAAVRIAERTGSIYLNDSGVEIEGVKIWGSPITPKFFDWAFMRDPGEEILRHWKLIPENLDILITHGPPFGFLDMTARGVSAGCADLLRVLTESLATPPRFHIFGHIHEAYGRMQLAIEGRRPTEFINASICDRRYVAFNKPVEFELSV